MTTPPATPQPVPGTGVPTCYRHRDRETYISCQRCGRPICPDCMTEAAVGFQCPECVAEGRRSIAQARTSFGGVIPSRPGVVSLTLIGLNLLVFALVQATGGAASLLVDRLSLHAESLCGVSRGFFYGASEAGCVGRGGTFVPGVADGAVWQMLTSVFLHVSVLHIAFNMFALYALGPQLEQVLGRWRFLAVYLLSGLAGSVLVYATAGPSTTLGASGAIFGLMGALLVIAYKVRGDYRSILFWIGLNFVITLVGAGYISWQAHLGGFLGGAALGALLAYAPRERRTLVQVGGFVAVGVVLVAITALRTLSLQV